MMNKEKEHLSKTNYKKQRLSKKSTESPNVSKNFVNNMIRTGVFFPMRIPEVKDATYKSHPQMLRGK